LDLGTTLSAIGLMELTFISWQIFLHTLLAIQLAWTSRTHTTFAKMSLTDLIFMPVEMSSQSKL
jgi:hypothetical protein